ncbi:fos-related antigen 1-like isoform X2 [Pecten maximus]|nr:fos-related antigen 1-like isoform X2 [Pecten maximus]XP_033735767.1 fos-related antigen 1-like isoform X2 [Pecten maximus]
MDCPTWIKQEPFSPVKKTFPDACSPTPIGQDIQEGSGDDQLQKAASDALAAGQLLPLIKKELKYTILNRRFAKGEADIILKDPPKPKAKQDLTAADLERKSRRREQNRRAATKCRNKKKGLEDSLLTNFYKEQSKNETLTGNIKTLRSEKARLEKILEEHLVSRECALSQRSTSYTPPLSAQLPPICYDQNTGSATSPSLYGGDIFTFDVQSNNKVCPVVSDPCTSYISQTPGQTSGYPQPSPDTFTSVEGPIYVPITPPAEEPSHNREFNWAENFLNISELLSRDLPEEIPVLSSDDLNNLAPSGL